jgi:hypothetical protein
MKNSYLILLVKSFACGCSTLSRTQIKAVNFFATTSKNFSAYPSKIMTGLADIRAKRGVYYANSLDNPRLHLQELDSIYSFKKENYAISAKVDITFKIIDKYAQSLLLLSSDKYVTDLQAQAINFGADLDSLTVTYNAISLVNKVPTSIGAAVGQLVAQGGKQFIMSKQAREIKKFVPAAGQLIEVMTGNLLEFLQSSTIDELINNEEYGISSSYLSYLRQIRTVSSAVTGRDSTIFSSNTKSIIANDFDYLALKTSLDAVKTLRQETVAATKKLQKAHNKLLSLIESKRTLTSTVPEIQQLYEEVNEIKKSIQNIQK